MVITPQCHTRTLRLTQTYKMILTVTYSNIHNETIIHTKKNYIRNDARKTNNDKQLTRHKMTHAYDGKPTMSHT